MTGSVAVRALEAFVPAAGLVGTVCGKPAVAELCIEGATLTDIDRMAETVERMANATGKPWTMIVTAYGRKPRGFDAARARWRMEGGLPA